MTHGHVALAPDVRLGEALLELARHAKVAQLDIAAAIHKHIRRLHVCTHGQPHVVSRVLIGQRVGVEVDGGGGGRRELGMGNGAGCGGGEEGRTSMYDLQVVLEELEPAHHAPRNAAQHVLRHARALELVQRAGVHVFHTVVHAAMKAHMTCVSGAKKKGSGGRTTR